VRTCEKLSGKERQDFLTRFNELEDGDAGVRKIADIKKIYVECGVDADARAEVCRYTEEALKAARKLKLGNVRYEVLRRFAEKLVSRAK
jgi:geranylgeranyl pyrophosphate synthase